MKYTYPATIEKKRDSEYLVRFPDFPSITFHVKSIEDAVKYSTHFLKREITILKERKENLPNASKIHISDNILIDISVDI